MTVEIYPPYAQQVYYQDVAIGPSQAGTHLVSSAVQLQQPFLVGVQVFGTVSGIPHGRVYAVVSLLESDGVSLDSRLWDGYVTDNVRASALSRPAGRQYVKLDAWFGTWGTAIGTLVARVATSPLPISGATEIFHEAPFSGDWDDHRLYPTGTVAYAIGTTGANIFVDPTGAITRGGGGGFVLFQLQNIPPLPYSRFRAKGAHMALNTSAAAGVRAVYMYGGYGDPDGSTTWFWADNRPQNPSLNGIEYAARLFMNDKPTRFGTVVTGEITEFMPDIVMTGTQVATGAGYQFGFGIGTVQAGDSIFDLVFEVEESVGPGP